MQAEYFRRFTDFARLDRDTLTSLQQHTRVLQFPGGRTLLREGRQLQGRFYLLSGSVRVGPPQAVIQAGTSRARQRLYPGVSVITTLDSTTLLHLDWERARFLAETPSEATHFDGGGWQERFLLSPMMRKTCPTEWRTILAELEHVPVSKGQRVVEEATPADGCFVLRDGHAVVHAGRHTFTYLMPGDFFGEDALVTGQTRNASVTMLEDGAVLRMPESVFRQMLLESVVPQVNVVGRGVLINTGRSSIEGAIHVSMRWLRQQLRKLDRSRPHYVVGGSEQERTLAALILIQAGFNASAVLD